MTAKIEWYRSLPRKRSAAGLVLRDSANRILLTKPPYKDYWQTVGGIIEDNETPRQAALRETQEEIGLVIASARLRVVDSVLDSQRLDSYQFIFDGGILSPEAISAIRPDKEEVTAFGFFEREEVEIIIGEKQLGRLSFLWDDLEGDQVFYLENGVRV